ncbi:hypothetical protein [Mucilaginibacter antarcticus]|uniref:hypothetical protein n=1 Tax=Mucilaginibacter antarcticus TaxID=1855725 RepID=UPI0036428D94
MMKKIKQAGLAITMTALSTLALAQKQQVTLVKSTKDKKIDVLIGGKPFTSFYIRTPWKSLCFTR